VNHFIEPRTVPAVRRREDAEKKILNSVPSCLRG